MLKKGYMLGMPITTQLEKEATKFGRLFREGNRISRAKSNSKRHRESGSVSLDEARKNSRIEEERLVELFPPLPYTVLAIL